MKRIVIAVWVVGVALALSHLLYLAGSPLPGFWLFTGVLLACYSLPFLMLTQIRVPEEKLSLRVVTLLFSGFILAVNLFIPAKRFLPGYRPQALEALVYLFSPILECVLIAIFFVIRGILTRGDKSRL